MLYKWNRSYATFGIDFFPLYFLFLKLPLSLSSYFLLLCWDFYLFIYLFWLIFLFFFPNYFKHIYKCAWEEGWAPCYCFLEIKDLASPVVSRDKAIREGFVTTHQASESQLSIQPPMPSQWRESRGEGTPSYSLGRVESVGSPFSLGCHGGSDVLYLDSININIMLEVVFYSLCVYVRVVFRDNGVVIF